MRRRPVRFPSWRSRSSPAARSYTDGALRNELLNLEIFDTLYEAQVLIALWRMEYSMQRSHVASACRPQAPEAFELFLASYVVQHFGGQVSE